MWHRPWIGLCASLVAVCACTDGFDSKRRSDGGSDTKETGSPAPTEAGRMPRDSSSGGSTSHPTPHRDAQVDPHPDGGGTGGAGGVDDGAVPPVPDASMDAGIRDASPDVVVPDAKPPLGWCDTFARGAFCADFDRARTVGEGWTSSEVTAGAALELNRLGYKSPPQSMRSKLPAGTGQNSAVSVLKKSLASTLGRTVLEFDCNVASIGTTSGDWTLQIAKLSRNDTEAIGIFARSAGTWSVIVAVGPIPVVYDLPAPPAYGKFVRISLDVVWSPTAGSTRVAIDGVQVLAKGGIITGQQPATKTIDFAIGLADASGSTPPAVVSFDNVTLEQH